MGGIWYRLGMDKNHGDMSLDRLLTRAEVERRTGLARSSIYRMMRAGQFPEPYRVGPKSVRWRESEIALWINSLQKSHGDRGKRAA